MKKYWFISEYYWPIENATGHIITSIIDEFSKYQKVNVITKGSGFGERNSNIKTYRVSDVNNLDKNKLLQRLLKLIVVSLNMIKLVVTKIKKGDVVVTVTNPAFIIIFLGILLKIKKFKLIIIVHDVFPENLIVSKVVCESNLVYKILKKIFDKSYSQANMLITCGRDMQEQMINKTNGFTCVKFIPNFANTNDITPLDKCDNDIIKNIKAENKFVILFTGNIGRLQGVEYLFKTMDELKHENDILWLFIGDGAFSSVLRNNIEINCIKNVLIIPNMPRDKSNIFLNAGDIGLATLMPSIRGTGVPSKTYTYMAAGKPILAIMDEDSEIARMVNETGIGWVVAPNEHLKLTNLLLDLKDNKLEVIQRGRKARELCELNYSQDIVTKMFVDAVLTI